MPLCKRDKRPALIYHCPKAAVGLGARLTTGTQLHHPRAGGLRAEFEPESPVLIAWPPSHLCHHQHGGMVGWMLRFWQVLCQGYLWYPSNVWDPIFDGLKHLLSFNLAQTVILSLSGELCWPPNWQVPFTIVYVALKCSVLLSGDLSKGFVLKWTALWLVSISQELLCS